MTEKEENSKPKKKYKALLEKKMEELIRQALESSGIEEIIKQAFKSFGLLDIDITISIKAEKPKTIKK